MRLLEEPRNPGVNDGKCALCKRGIDPEKWDDLACAGCGYHVCEECSVNQNMPFGPHYVVAHQDDEY